MDDTNKFINYEGNFSTNKRITNSCINYNQKFNEYLNIDFILVLRKY